MILLLALSGVRFAARGCFRGFAIEPVLLELEDLVELISPLI